jgi:hypothetical protein
MQSSSYSLEDKPNSPYPEDDLGGIVRCLLREGRNIFFIEWNSAFKGPIGTLLGNNVILTIHNSFIIGPRLNKIPLQWNDDTDLSDQEIFQRAEEAARLTGKTILGSSYEGTFPDNPNRPGLKAGLISTREKTVINPDGVALDITSEVINWVRQNPIPQTSAPLQISLPLPPCNAKKKHGQFALPTLR